MEIELTDVFARVKVITVGLEQVTISLPMGSYTMVVFVLILFILAVAVIVG